MDEEELNRQLQAMKDSAAADLAGRPLPNNPTKTYLDVLTPEEGQAAVFHHDPKIGEFALEHNLHSPEAIQEALDFDPLVRARAYNTPPIEFNVRDRYKDYWERQQRRELLGVDQFNFPVVDERAARVFGLLDDPQDLFLSNRTLPLSPPRNLAREQEIASWGVEPQNNPLKFNDESTLSSEFTNLYGIPDTSGDAYNFSLDVSLSPRNMTKEQYAHIGQKYGLNGEFSYINPKKESLGVKYTPEGGGPAQLVNPPGLDGGDVVNFLMQEAPALAGEFALARLFPGMSPSNLGLQVL